MWRYLFFVFLAFMVHSTDAVRWHDHQLCGNTTQRARGCTTQILGREHADIDSCTIETFPANSQECKKMQFSPIDSNAFIGGVNLKPYILSDRQSGYSVNYTVLNITFTNIKWKTMKFRFQLAKPKHLQNHCRNIVLSNEVTVNDQSVLYYDCYWSTTDGNYTGQSHYLDFEATDENRVVNRGQYYFNIPSAQMLSPTVTEEEWLPFLYLEILNDRMRLHINPPPPQLNIAGYEIKVMKEADKGTQVDKVTILKLKNTTKDVMYDYSLLNNGSYNFVVTPLHAKCQAIGGKCLSVESPKIVITSEIRSLNVCIASITALLVATLFAYYIVLRVIRRYWCKDYGLALVPGKIPAPTQVLVIYSPVNRLHAECVTSFVTYLRSEYGFDVMFDGDISATSHGDPYIWAEEAFRLASHVMYIVGPTEEANIYNNIYDKPIINAHRNVDKLLLTRLRSDRVAKNCKDVLNVFFEHSDGEVPIETKHAKVFFLLKDWQKLIAYLSKNLLPKQHIMRTEKGKNFLDDLAKAKKVLSERHQC
ncbi:uncharacterized protein LOC126371723 [Pectinophora gossypiella]|uniref:SEFIR domain-containing protein n=1 Tax=Pectinophora gossypiella TaxID=13191 RepID=A0A1E1W7V7_PECGO|nr:uncharacterized protein LOC126371723 [Pectinophora gossypiella]